MNPDQEEDRIRELMAGWRQRDEAEAPEFAKVWGAAVARAKFERRRYFLRVTAIAASLALLGVIIARVSVRERTERAAHVASWVSAGELPWQSSVLICEWRSPTDFLLRLPGEQPWERSRAPVKASEQNNKYQ